MIEIRKSLNKNDKKEVYNFLVYESEEVDKSHKLMTEGGFKIYFPYMFQLICNDNKLDKYSIFKQKMWHFFNEDYTIHYCPICGKPTKFISIKKGYRYYCSNECKYNDKEYLKKVSENSKNNWTKYNKEEVCRNISKGKINNWNKFTYEERQKKTQHLRNALQEANKNRSKEEWKEINDKRVAAWKETYDNKSDEQKQKETQKRVIKQRETLKNRTEEEIKIFSDKIKLGLINMSDEAKKQREINKHNANVKRIQKIRPDVIDVETINGKSIYICKCTNFNCNKCQLKQYRITYASYKYRKSIDIETCPICHPRTIGISGGEKELLDYIKKIYKHEIKENTRHELEGLEIDVYLPELKIGFEFQGDLWYANPMLFDENFVNPVNGRTYNEIHDKDNHKKKIAEEKGITLIEIWESDWVEHNKSTKSYIKKIIKEYENRSSCRQL